MKKKNGFAIREVCGEKVIIGEGLEAINFGKIISMNGLHSGFTTQGRASQPVYSPSSASESPICMYITAASPVTRTFGRPSAKYSVGTHDQGEIFFCINEKMV